MLKIENKKLKSEQETISTSDCILTIESDLNCKLVGILTLLDRTKKVITFNQVDSNKYQGRLIVTKSDLPVIRNSLFNVIMIDSYMNETTNPITLKFDTESIAKDIKVSASNEIAEIKEDIIKLNSIVESFKYNHVLTSIPIVNKEYIQPGMIPVAIDSNGNFMACQPFSNHITEVNGIKAVNGSVEIEAKDIVYSNNKSVTEGLNNLSEAVIKLNDLLTTVINNQKEMRSRLDAVEIKIEAHLNDGII